MSLCHRAAEKRHHAEVARRQKEDDLARQKQEVRNRLMDAKYAELAREREMAMIAMENLKHKSCSFAAVNPFEKLLDGF